MQDSEILLQDVVVTFWLN